MNHAIPPVPAIIFRSRPGEIEEAQKRSDAALKRARELLSRPAYPF